MKKIPGAIFDMSSTLSDALINPKVALPPKCLTKLPYHSIILPIGEPFGRSSGNR